MSAEVRSRGHRPVVTVVALVVTALVVVAAGIAAGRDGGSPGGMADPPADPGTADPGVDPDPPSDGSEPDAHRDPDAADEPPGEPTDDVPPRGRLVVHHVGDVNLDPRVVPVLAAEGPSAAWDGVRATFADADLVLANLECAASELGAPEPKQYTFRCDLAALPALRDAGVDVVTLANNHSGDYGMDAMVDSVANVEAAGIAAVGVGRDEDEAYRPHLVEVAGWRVAILGFGGVVPEPWWTARGALPGQATGYDAQRMARAVADARAQADVVVATVHWGEEGSLEPRAQDRVKAAAMIEAGADLVVGHHAHRLQPLEVVDDVPVLWGLGNFVWPRTSAAGARTAVGSFVLEPDGRRTACLLPFEIDGRGVPAPTGASPTCEQLPPRDR